VIINSQKRSFGKGPKVSVFTLGTMRSAESAIRMYDIIKLAHHAGINHLETAPSYGRAEIFVGEALDKLDQCEKISKKNWVITTKILPNGNFKELKEKFFDSLINLNIKKINNLAIHGLNLFEHLEWVLQGEGRKFINWLLSQKLIDQIGFKRGR